jgi:glycosyltransferase involved in cell wall biosynthesis
MVLSILICTYNREHFLKLCLDSIIEQTKHCLEKKIEIIIIDNNSNDNTKNLIKNYKSITPIIYYLEKEQGLSYARNSGINIANGNYIAFVDDDATINKNWLNALLVGIETIKADGFGGPIYPRFEVECPSWIDKEYFIRRFKSKDGYLNQLVARGGFSGGNMCIHKSIFEKIGNFDINLGMKGNKLGLGEESELFYRLFTTLKESKLYNITEMSITHFEAAFKLEKQYLKDRILLSGKQFSLQNIKENKIKGYLMISLKITKQSIDLIFNLLQIKKFKLLRNLWTIQGLIKGTFTL